MANTTVYPYGTGGQLPSSIGIINDLTTGGADKALSAQQGKIIGEELYGSGRMLVDTSSLTRYGVYINSSTGKWADSPEALNIFIPVSPGEKYQVVSSASLGAIFTVLQSDSHTSGTTPLYATGYSGLITISPGSSSEEFTIPENGHFILLLVQYSAGTTNSEVYKLTQTVTTPGLVERFNSAEEELSNVHDDIYGTGRTLINLSNLTKYHSYIAAATGQWATSSAIDIVFVPVSTGETYEVVASAQTAIYSVLQTNSHTDGTYPSYADGYNGTITVQAGESSGEFTVPSNGHYILVFLKTSAGQLNPELYQISGEISDGLNGRVSSIESYLQGIDFQPSGVHDNDIDYIKSIQLKTKVLTIREQEIAPTSGVNITAYEGHLYCTIDGVKYEINMTQVNNE